MKKYIAEFIGTFGLVFIGTGSMVVNDTSNGAVGLVGIGIAFGLIVTTMIYVFGPISGAHINPAVTISVAIDEGISKKDAVFYIAAQVLGAILASILLRVLFPEHKTLGTTMVSGSVFQSFTMEVVSTFLLMLVILGVTQQGNESSKSLAGIVIGAIVMAMIFVAGPISGGSFNPARSIGPALISGNFQHLWLYLGAPILGAILAVVIWKFVRE